MIFFGRYGVAETFVFPVIAAGAQNYQASATLAAGDAKVSTDGAADANADNIPTVTPAAGRSIEWTASAAEMTGKRCVLTMVDAAGAEWEDQMITVYTYGNDLAHIPFNLTALMSLDMGSISGDSTAADNLELQYDETGLTGSTFPSTQAQLDQVANVGGVQNESSESFTIPTGTEAANTYAVTEALDGVYHTLNDAAGTLDAVYQFDIGASGSPNFFQWTGTLQGSNDAVDLQAYHWDNAAWATLKTVSGTNPATVQVKDGPMFGSYVGTGANLGKVQIRASGTGLTSATFQTDQIYVGFADTNRSVGYALGAVWIDTLDGTAGTVRDTNGVADNPSLTFADAQVVGAAIPLKKYQAAPGSVVTLAAAFDGQEISGEGWTLALGGQSIDRSHFFKAAVSGVGISANEVEFNGCEFGVASVQVAHFYDCTFVDTITYTLAGDYLIINGQSGVAGSGSPTFTKTAGQAVTVSFRRWSGGITQSGIEAGDVFTISGELGTVTLNGDGGDVEIRGTYKAIVDNRTGTPGLNVAGAVKGGLDAAAISVLDATMTSYLDPGSVGEQISAAGGGASGAFAITFHTQTTAGATVPLVAVSIRDETDTTTLKIGTTALASGNLARSLDAGTYQIRMALGGHNPVSVPQEVVVTADETVNLIIDPFTIAATSDPTKCTIHGRIGSQAGGVKNVRVRASSIVPSVAQGIQQHSETFEALTDANGDFTLDLTRLSTVALTVDYVGYETTNFLVPDLGTQDIATWVQL